MDGDYALQGPAPGLHRFLDCNGPAAARANATDRFAGNDLVAVKRGAHEKKREERHLGNKGEHERTVRQTDGFAEEPRFALRYVRDRAVALDGNYFALADGIEQLQG